MREIPLTQGKVALVDDCDYEYLNQWKWCAHNHGYTFYAVRTSRKSGKQDTILMHRIVGKRMGLDMSLEVDHIKRNGLNNQRRNLRSATDSQQKQNQSIQKNNISGYRGVSWNKQTCKWRAEIWYSKKHIFLGYFDDIKDAIKARKAAERKYFTHAETV